MEYRFAGDKDLDLLAQWNYQLIQDEGHHNSMTLLQHRNRMSSWIQSDYKAVILEKDKAPIGYALYRENDDEVYLRHFLVKRDERRKGLGSKAIDLLRKELFPPQKRLTVEALTINDAGLQFWRKAGFTDYCIKLESLPRQAGQKAASDKFLGLSKG